MASLQRRRPRFRPSLFAQIVGLGVLSVALTIAYFALISYRLEYQAEEERFGLALDRIAATAALSIDGDEHRRIRSNADAQGPEFKRVREHLERVRAANYLRFDQIYTFHPISDSELRFAVMLHERPFVGDVYRVVPENVSVVMKVMQQRTAMHTRLYRDAHGTWVSAYAPIFDRQGQLAGILEVDYTVDEFLQAVAKTARKITLISLIGLALSAAVSFALAHSVGRALRKIRLGIQEIEKQNFGHRIQLSRGDELGLIATQINHMAATLAERYQMLKFLPQHTIEAIARRALRGHASMSERRVGAVFFSDIRGYTALSAENPDEKIVQMLNHYLSRQAEIIEQHGGVIDKFMGDAVLALFQGDGAARRAVAAALAIREAVERLNREAVFLCPVHIGIGISFGNILLGEIGSDLRRERTPVGSVVNLASRLGSRAGAEEILISDSARQAIGDDLQISASEAVVLKGFNDPQTAHFVTGLRSAAAVASSSTPEKE
jgi:class 3 adenylate cyclase